MDMHAPAVSFIIPCYKLAHFLPECVNSILSQTYGDFEVLILDDCSPDNTVEVVASFRDARVKHIRNEQNLGPLRNYNKGIRLSRGKYVWLISADDYLRSQNIVERYIQLMECHPHVGYVFCPAVGVNGGMQTGVLEYSEYATRDLVVSGHEFVRQLLERNIIVTPSVMTRRECYEQLSVFPLDPGMVWSGDWYLWCLFALYYDVAYIAEPMVCYRIHESSMTTLLTSSANNHTCATGDIAVPWMLRRVARARGLHRLSKSCLRAVASEYARHAVAKEYRESYSRMESDQFEVSLRQYTENERERNWIRGRFFAAIGDRLWDQNERAAAKAQYWAALHKDPWMLKAYAKVMILSLGRIGDYLRERIRSYRRALRSHSVA